MRYFWSASGIIVVRNLKKCELATRESAGIEQGIEKCSENTKLQTYDVCVYRSEKQCTSRCYAAIKLYIILNLLYINYKNLSY